MRLILAHISERATRTLCRVIWAALLLLHMPAWLAVIGKSAAADSELDLLRLLAMTLVQGFFVLKVVDVRWLRIPRNSRSWLAFGLIVTLMHGDVARRALAGNPRGSAANSAWAAIVITATGFAEAVRRTRNRVDKLDCSAARALRDNVRALLRSIFNPIHDAHFKPVYLLIARDALLNRAPPRA